MLAKSLTLPSCDNITYDLEDSVTPVAKPSARAALRDHLARLYTPSSNPPSCATQEKPKGEEGRKVWGRPQGIGEIAVRINAVSTNDALADLQAVATCPVLDTIVVPKVNSAADLTFVADILRHLAPDRFPSTVIDSMGNQVNSLSKGKQPRSIRILALIESALAITNLSEITRSLWIPSPSSAPFSAVPSVNLLDGLIFAAEDFALDLSLTRTPSLSEFAYARGAIAIAARAARLSSTIDLVCTSLEPPSREVNEKRNGNQEQTTTLEYECIQGRQMGFNGKQCIHPSQVETVQRLFSPEEAEVQWAVRVVAASEKAAAGSKGDLEGKRGAFKLDGNMIDAPVVAKAEAIIAKAEKCELNVEKLKAEWEHQEPE